MVISELIKNKIGKKDNDYELSQHNTLQGYKKLNMEIAGYPVYYRRENEHSYSLVTIIVRDSQNKKCIARLGVEPTTFFKNFIKTYDVFNMATNSAYQGQGIGLALYTGLVTILKINLASTGSHSVGAVKMWSRMSADPGITVYAVDTATKQFYTVKQHNDSLKIVGTKKSLYGSTWDGVLIAVEKNCPDDVKIQQYMKKTKDQDIFGTPVHMYTKPYG